MRKLCKHFRHKIAVQFDEVQARAEFPYGLCLMRADQQALSFECQAQTQEALDQMRAVLDEHLGRFARKEALLIDWQALPGQSPD